MSEQSTVADYIVRRLAREGITDCFGVAGDFAFKLCDAVARSEAIRWIGCSNELDAAYAADGYARVRGCSMLMTTYAVGELSALNGVMGAKAERSCVFHVVGMPTHAQAAGPPDRPPHARRRGVPELREHLGAGGVCVGGDHPRQLRPRNGAADRHRPSGESARLHPRRLRLRRHPGSGLRPGPVPEAHQRSRPRQGRRSNHRADSRPHDQWPCFPPTQSRGSSFRAGSRR